MNFSARGDIGIGDEIEIDHRVGATGQHRFVNRESRVAETVLGKAEHRLGGLGHLTDFNISRGDDASAFDAQLRIGQSVLRSRDLRFGDFDRPGRGAQSLIGEIEGGAGGEAGVQQSLLPFERRLSLMQGRLRAGQTRLRGVQIGLLLGRIETRQNRAGLHMATNLAEPFDHAARHAK